MSSENMLEKVTLIVPVYNVEDYLDRCMDSVLGQTYENLEIILVDDGSTDNSGKMCDEYKAKDSRIYVIHQKNAGLSAARNVALDIMAGEYVMFIDSDDKVDKRIVEHLLEDMHKYKCDIVECGIYDVYGNKIMEKKLPEKTRVYTVEEALCIDIGAMGGAVSACAKLYKRDIFSTVRYREGKIGEDGYAIVDVLSQAESIVIDNRPMYYYYHRRNSITTNTFTKANLDNIQAYKYNLKQVKHKYPSVVPVVVFRLDWCYLIAVDRILMCDDWKENEYLPKLMRYIKKNKRRMLMSSNMRRNRKIALIILLFNKKLYRKVLLWNMRGKYGI
ncbi:hypothetical protein C810_03873 [Lachnospiraceae bacterium A2]|nr:hypothetical protein C810_03873 [Lachnospiraceae bacterium A2]